MAVTHTKTISGLVVLNNPDYIVQYVEIQCVSIDDTNPSVARTSHTVANLDVSGITTTTAGFTTYANLTESQVRNWTPVADELSDTSANAGVEAWLESMKTPPIPLTITPPLPW